MYDVIGIQSHMHGGYWGAARTWDVCERFAKFGKPLHFTETTVVSGPKKDSTWTTTPEGEQRAGEAGGRVLHGAVLASGRRGRSPGGISRDQDAWQQAPAGLVRSDMTPKPAYEQLHGLIKGKWWTKVEATTGPAGATVPSRAFSGSMKSRPSWGTGGSPASSSLDKGHRGGHGCAVGLDP